LNGALAPHRSGHGHISTSGPDLVLQPKQALALSVAVHELATNAAKYGSLSSSGKVDILWAIEMIGTVPSFRFQWSESGGPPVSEPAPGQRGFGSRLIEQMLGNDFNGRVHIHFRPDGLVCELIGPATALTNAGQRIGHGPVGS
jgi:two-component sensor histidine kinase